MRATLLNSFIVLLIIVVLLEVTSFVGVKVLKERLVFYNKPSIATFESYMSNRHSTLGWPSQTVLKEKHDPSGSRPIPAFAEVGNACVSLYGDSFTWSDLVDDEHAWSNVLSKRLNCRVANYAVAGYGTDQAFLRFQENTDDEAPIVILNHFTGDIRRNVNQLRNFISKDDYFLLKPRFVLEDGGLKLIPLLNPTLETAKLLVESPEKVLKHEYFLLGGQAGIQEIKFPFSISFLSAFGNEHVRAKFQGETVWGKFYDPTHPSKALTITALILTRFVELTRERNKQPVVTIIPNAHDIHYYLETGLWSYEPLVDSLKENNIDVFHMGPGFVEYLGGRDVCELTEETCYGLYKEEGDSVIAKLVHEYLESNDFIYRKKGRYF